MRKSFTLIELLVVIAIIAILASMLMPALSKARAKARAITCVNNMKQLALYTAMYEDDYEEMVPIQNCYKGLPQWVLSFVDGDNAKIGKEYFCPLKYEGWATNRQANTYGVKYAGNAKTNYEINHGNPQQYATINTKYTGWFNLKGIKDPSTYMLFADSVRFGTTNPGWGGYHLNKGSSIGMHFCHEQRANFIWADFHVDSKTAKEIKYGALKDDAYTAQEVYRQPSYTEYYTF